MSKRLGELLIHAGAARPEDIKAALDLQTSGDGRRLGTILLERKAVKTEPLARALSELHDVPFVEIRRVDPAVGSLLSAEFLTESRMVPFKLERSASGDRIHLAVEDPSDFALVDELRFQLRKAITLYVAPVDQIDDAIEAIRQGLTGASVEVEEEIPLEEEIELEGELVEEDETASSPVEVSSEVELPDEWADPTGPKNELREAKPAEEIFDLTAKKSVEDWGAEMPPVPVESSGAGASASAGGVAARAELPRTSTPAGGVAAQVGEPESRTELPRTATPAEGVAAPVGTARAEPLRTETPSAGMASVETTTADPSQALTPPGGTPVPVVAPPSAPPPPAPTEKSAADLDFSESDLAVLDAIERLAGGDETVVETEKVKPARMVAALTRLLMKKGVIDEHEFLDELSRK